MYRTPTHEPEVPSDIFMHLVASNQYAALALLTYDMLLRFDQERDFIWGTNFRNTPVQWTFLFIRYFALAAKISIVFVGHTVNNPLNFGSYNLCMEYILLQAITSQLMLTAVHLVLMSRVRMLYAKSRHIVDALFASLLLAEAASMIRNCIVTFPHIRFGPHCIAYSTSVDTVYYGVIMVTLQSAIILLTFVKYFEGVQNFRPHVAIISLLMRDGTWAFVAIVTCQIMSTVMVLRYGSAGFTLIQSWQVALLSCIGCRLIINLHDLGRRDVLDTESIPLEAITTPSLLYGVDWSDEN